MKTKKITKIFAATGLALIMGAGVLCGTLIPMNSACATTSAGATSASNSGDPAALAQSADSAQAEWAENILSGDLNLDPENDPVVFTTDYGLEIKSHDAGELTASLKGSAGSTTVSGTSWNYISAGGYDWIIIGSYSTSSYTISTIAGNHYAGLADSTPAGTAVKNDASKQTIKIKNLTVPAFSNAKAGYNGEIPIGCVLCLCAGNITTTAFNKSTSSGNNYSGSDLQTYINDTVYPKVKSLPIVPQKLTTLYYNSATSTINNAYVFPLAGANNTESFYVGSYLDSAEKRALNTWWQLRSGSASYSDYAYFVNTDGSVYDAYGYTGAVNGSYGVRPAFVLQLYSA